MIVVSLATALLLGVMAVTLRDPLVRRIGLRNVRRRPREAALVMLGCILGTGVIVGNLSVGDSLTASLEAQALGEYGNLDAIVRYENKQDWSAATAQMASQPVRYVAAATPVATVSAPITSRSGDGVSPRAKLVEADYRRAGDLGAAPGQPLGSGPTAGTTWVSTRAADELGLRVGTVIEIHSQAHVTLRVTRVVTNALTSFLDGSYRAGASYLVPAGTIETLKQRDPALVFPDYRTLVIGDDNVATETLRRSLTRVAGPFDGTVEMSRADRLASARAQGQTTGAFLTTIGSLGILAGILLLVNVLLMLAEERMSEMGMMRAVGMARSPLIGSFALEGTLYAVAGSLLGGGLGVFMGRILVRFLDQMTNDSAGDYRALPLHFAIERPTLLTGIALGFVVATIAVIATSYRVSRLEVIRAIRDLPAPKRQHRQAAIPLLILGLVLGPLVGSVGYTAASPLLLVGGPVIFCACLGVLVNRRFGYEPAMVIATIPLIVFGMLFNLINPVTAVAPTGGVLAGSVTAIAGVLLLNALQGRLAALFRRLGRGRQTLPTRLGLANPIAHRVRMLLTVLPFALVVFTLTYAEGLGNLITTELRRVAPAYAGGYTVFSDSSTAHPFDYGSYRAEGLIHVARTGTSFASFTYDPKRNSKVWPVTAFDTSLFATVPPPVLVERAREYPSDEAAYRAVFGDPDLMIIDPGFMFQGLFGTGSDDPTKSPAVGDVYTMFNPVTGAARDVRVAAIRYPDVLGNGALYGLDGARQMFGDQLVLSDAFLAHVGDHDAFIDELQRAGIESGVQARDTRRTSEASTTSINGLINLLRSDLGIGITVGVAGIGVVLVRSVRDRRHQIGVLRAMGVDAGEVGRSFLIEGAFVAVQGLIVGVVLSYMCVLALPKSNLVRSLLGFEPGLPRPPWTVVLIAVGLFVAALAASVLPARSASRIPPAVALRLVD